MNWKAGIAFAVAVAVTVAALILAAFGLAAIGDAYGDWAVMGVASTAVLVLSFLVGAAAN